MKKMQMNVYNTLPKLFEKLRSLCTETGFTEKRVVIWGLQKASYIASQYFSEIGIKVIGIVDNDEKKWGKISKSIRNSYEETYEVEVFSPEQLLRPAQKDIVILVFSRYYKEILEQVKSYGYEEKQCRSTYDASEMVETEDLKELQPIFVEEQKNLEFDILMYLKEVCERNHLRYFLSAGTLLGAVRHKGFIPWDDDIDVYMPWKDYLKLIDLFKNGKEENEKYSLLYHGICSNYSWIYVKLQDNRTISRGVRYPLICEIGINIDIFPMGGFPEQKAEQEMLKERIQQFQTKWSRHLTYWGMGDKYDFPEAKEEIAEIMGKYDFDESPYVGYIINGLYDLEVSSYESYSSTIKLEFEGEYFDAPVGYDEYLTHTYGDYMEIPPEWQRAKMPHVYKGFWRD